MDGERSLVGEDILSSVTDAMHELDEAVQTQSVKSFLCGNKKKQIEARAVFEGIDKTLQVQTMNECDKLKSFAYFARQALREALPDVKQLAIDSDLPDVQGNGYWALLRVLSCCLQKLCRKAQRVAGTRGRCVKCSNSMMRSDVRDLSTYARILDILKELLQSCLVFQKQQEDASRAASEAEEASGFESGLLFLDVPMQEVHQLFDQLDLPVLYGDMHGYQYPTRLKHFLRVVVLAAATHSKSMKHRQQSCQCCGLFELLSAAKHSVAYFFNPDSKGRRVADQYNHGDIEFLKSFWNLTEMPVSRQFGKVVGAHLARCRVITIDGSTPIRMPKATGPGEIQVSFAPSEDECASYCGPDYRPPLSVPCRLLSYRTWKGQEGVRSGAPCPNLIVHFHGGGFVAQSSASHETYLRDWAKRMDCPILSVDYGLGPEHPFPVAVDQAFYAYCWALQHAAQLGSTAEHVVCVGDSAGGNLAAHIGIRCAEEGVRAPDGIVMLYPVLFVALAPSPSRCLTLMDSLLPLGSLELCMDAYCGRFGRLHTQHQLFLSKFPNAPVPGHALSAQARRRQHHLSPVVAPDSVLARFPPCAILASELDPLLDDSITFAKRLRRAKQSADEVTVSIANLLPHGWLNMYFIGDQTSIACSEQACVWMDHMLNAAPRQPSTCAV